MKTITTVLKAVVYTMGYIHGKVDFYIDRMMMRIS